MDSWSRSVPLCCVFATAFSQVICLFLPAPEDSFLLKQNHFLGYFGIGAYVRGGAAQVEDQAFREFSHLKLCVSGGVHCTPGGVIVLIPFQGRGQGPAAQHAPSGRRGFCSPGALPESWASDHRQQMIPFGRICPGAISAYESS